MKISTIAELNEAKKRIEEIGFDIEDLRDEIADLEREEERTQREIEAFEKGLNQERDSLAKQLWESIQRHWQRYTWTEQQIAARAAEGEDLVGEEKRRFRLLCAMELGVTV